MAYKPKVLEIAAGGSNASTFTQSNGIVTYNGTSLVNYAGPQISSSGIYTNTSQPAFLANLSSNVDNVTGNNTTYTIAYNTEVFDQGNNFASNTFTAPVTGRYFFSAGVDMSSVTSSTTGAFTISTSNRAYITGQISSTAVQNGVGAVSFQLAVIADMDAADTATVTIRLNGIGADTADVVNSNTINIFGGCLLT